MTYNALESWYNFDTLLGVYNTSGNMDIAEESAGINIKNFGRWLRDKVIELWNKFKDMVKNILLKIQSKLKKDKNNNKQQDVNEEARKVSELFKALDDMCDNLEKLSVIVADNSTRLNDAIKQNTNIDYYIYRLTSEDTPNNECKKYIDTYHKAYERVRDLKKSLSVDVFDANRDKINKKLNDMKSIYSLLERYKNTIILLSKTLELNPEHNSHIIKAANASLADFTELQMYFIRVIWLF